MNKKQLTLITLATVVIGAVLVNEFVRRNLSEDQNRDVASFGERFEPEQIRWEQELAKIVSKETTGKTLVAEKPSWNDKFLFEALEGRYEAVVAEGKLLNIRLQPNQTAIELDTQKLIAEYAAVFKNAQSYDKAVDGKYENVILKNSTGKAIGKVVFERDDQGRVLSITIQ